MVIPDPATLNLITHEAAPTHQRRLEFFLPRPEPARALLLGGALERCVSDVAAVHHAVRSRPHPEGIPPERAAASMGSPPFALPSARARCSATHALVQAVLPPYVARRGLGPARARRPRPGA